MRKSITKLAGATGRAFAATLAVVGVTAVLGSVETARAWDQQASSAALDDEINWQAAGQGYALVPRTGAYGSARRGRRIESAKSTQKDFQDIK